MDARYAKYVRYVIQQTKKQLVRLQVEEVP